MLRHYHDISGLYSWLFLVEVIRSLSNNESDGYGYENVTQKVNLRFLKLYRGCSIWFNSSNLGNFFLELNSKGLYQSSRNEKESCCLVWPSSTKHEIMQFHVVVVQWRLRNVQKSVMHVQSCCFVNLNLFFFCRSRCRRRRRCLSSIMFNLTYLLLFKPPRSSQVTYPACRGLSVPAWF